MWYQSFLATRKPLLNGFLLTFIHIFFLDIYVRADRQFAGHGNSIPYFLVIQFEEGSLLCYWFLAVRRRFSSWNVGFYVPLVYCNMRENEFASAATKCDVPTQTQNPGTGMDATERVP